MNKILRHQDSPPNTEKIILKGVFGKSEIWICEKELCNVTLQVSGKEKNFAFAWYKDAESFIEKVKKQIK